MVSISNRRRIRVLNDEIDASGILWPAVDSRLRKGPFEGTAIAKAFGFVGK